MEEEHIDIVLLTRRVVRKLEQAGNAAITMEEQVDGETNRSTGRAATSVEADNTIQY